MIDPCGVNLVLHEATRATLKMRLNSSLKPSLQCPTSQPPTGLYHPDPLPISAMSSGVHGTKEATAKLSTPTQRMAPH